MAGHERYANAVVGAQSAMMPGLLNRRVAAIGMLGFAAGLPLALSDSTLQAWLTVSGVDVATIGVFSLVGLPYVLKFLWAPLLDRYQPGWPGRRRDWILAAQAVLVVLLAAAGLLDIARDSLPLLGALALLIAFTSATQDVAIDAYRSDVLNSAERGFGAAVFVAGYRVAMLVAGAGALLLADRYGFAEVYLLMAALMVLGMVGTVIAPDLPRNVVAPETLRAAVLEPLRDFFQRDGAVTLLWIVFLYKLGDAFAGRLTTNFLLSELGFTLSEVGAIYKGLGLAATLAGALFGGAMMFKLGLYRALFGFAWLQAATNLGFCALALIGKSYVAMITAVAMENLTGGMGTAAFVALLMAACNARYSATQFALLTAIASIGRVLAGPPAGLLVQTWGWPIFFFLTFLIALPAIVLIHRQRALIERTDSSRAAD